MMDVNRSIKATRRVLGLDFFMANLRSRRKKHEGVNKQLIAMRTMRKKYLLSADEFASAFCSYGEALMVGKRKNYGNNAGDTKEYIEMEFKIAVLAKSQDVYQDWINTLFPCHWSKFEYVSNKDDLEDKIFVTWIELKDSSLQVSLEYDESFYQVLEKHLA